MSEPESQRSALFALKNLWKATQKVSRKNQYLADDLRRQSKILDDKHHLYQGVYLSKKPPWLLRKKHDGDELIFVYREGGKPNKDRYIGFFHIYPRFHARVMAYRILGDRPHALTLGDDDEISRTIRGILDEKLFRLVSDDINE